MYTKIRSENRSKNYRINTASIQFLEASNQVCGGMLVICRNLSPGMVQEIPVPARPCNLAFTVVTYDWTYLPSGKGGASQGPRRPNNGTQTYGHYWNDPTEIDHEIFGSDLTVAPLLEEDASVIVQSIVTSEEISKIVERSLKSLTTARDVTAGSEPSPRLLFPNGVELIYFKLAFAKDIEATIAIAGEKAKYPSGAPTDSTLTNVAAGQVIPGDA